MNQSTVLVGVTDHLDPEEQAMLLAQYSRSYGSILTRVPNRENFLTETEYLAATQRLKTQLRKTYNSDSLAKNYGHKSVGQLGHTTVFFEGVSMLAAIAIEVSELFNGQESSTRYIDYSTQEAIDCGNDEIRHWQEVWRQFYKAALAETITELYVKYPKPENASDANYERTIKARAFDICGGILPAGFTTCVGFTGSFDVLNDHITWMAQHPLKEVRELAKQAAEAMMDKFPNAAFPWEKIQERSEFMQFDGPYSDSHVEAYYLRHGSFEQTMLYSNYPDTFGAQAYPIVDEEHHRGRDTCLQLNLNVNFSTVSAKFTEPAMLKQINKRLLELKSDTRSKYTSFPRPLSNAIRFRWTSVMDFRSYRDMHRHRNGYRPLPLLDMDWGVHEYYLENLPGRMQRKFNELWHDQRDWLTEFLAVSNPREHNQRRLEAQYAIPMGSEIPYYYECDLNQILYMQELRTDKTVHQTVRIELLAVYDQFKDFLPEVKVHADTSPNNFTLKRGAQTFSQVL